MQTVEEFAGAFPSESVLQQALAKLLSKISHHSGVQILQGSQELGKDIIFYTPGPFGEKDLNACVVKNTKITGNASTAVGAFWTWAIDRAGIGTWKPRSRIEWETEIAFGVPVDPSADRSDADRKAIDQHQAGTDQVAACEA
jgi:hypothetical protein